MVVFDDPLYVTCLIRTLRLARRIDAADRPVATSRSPRVELDAAEKTHAGYVFLFYGLPVLAVIGTIAVAAALQLFRWLKSRCRLRRGLPKRR